MTLRLSIVTPARPLVDSDVEQVVAPGSEGEFGVLPGHAPVLVDLGLDMLQAAHDGSGGHPLQLRVGISSGPAVAGVIGRTKFQYDIWGDTVNTASRMESHGVPGRIHVSESTRLLIEDAYICESRGIINVKGKGPMPTHLVVGPRWP